MPSEPLSVAAMVFSCRVTSDAASAGRVSEMRWDWRATVSGSAKRPNASTAAIIAGNSERNA